jgi:2-amino-4-hydroxy-6-hydroxymethyldihydropteridine diphosphokinase
MMTKVFLGLGSNIGPRKRNIEAAIDQIRRLPGVRLRAVSSLYETEPVGGPKQGAFLNAAAEISTSRAPLPLLNALLRIEKGLKRLRRTKWGPRTIDLDILTYGRRVLSVRGLRIPHPRYQERRFVLIPLAEIAPKLSHPVLKATPKAFLRRLTLHGQRVTILARWKKSHFVLSKRKRRTKSP